MYKQAKVNQLGKEGEERFSLSYSPSPDRTVFFQALKCSSNTWHATWHSALGHQICYTTQSPGSFKKIPVLNSYPTLTVSAWLGNEARHPIFVCLFVLISPGVPTCSGIWQSLAKWLWGQSFGLDLVWILVLQFTSYATLGKLLKLSVPQLPQLQNIVVFEPS